MTRKFRFCILLNFRVVVLSNTKIQNTLLGNVLKCFIVKITLVSFNCFSEYIISMDALTLKIYLIEASVMVARQLRLSVRLMRS